MDKNIDALNEIWSSKYRPTFEQRFATLSASPYNARFASLIESAHRRHFASTEGVDTTPEFSGDDIRTIRENVLKKIDSGIELPRLPQVVEKLDALLSSPDASAKDAADVIMLDPGTTGRVLSWVNSAASSLSRKISKVEEAVALMGLAKVKKIVLAASVQGTFNAIETDYFSTSAFWQHSLAVASATMLFAKTFSETHGSKIDLDDAFLAGMLHDAGKLVLVEHFRPQAIEIHNLTQEESLSTYDAELAILGVHHTELGHRLLRHWGLSDDICNSALNHHEPGESSTLVYAVHVANAIAHGLGVVSLADGSFPTLDAKGWTELDLADSVIESIAFRMLEQLDETAEMLSKPN